MVIFKRVSNNPYKIQYKLAPLTKVANAESVITPNLMVDRTRFSQEFRDYITPLISGEVKLIYKDGVATMANFKKQIVK